MSWLTVRDHRNPRILDNMDMFDSLFNDIFCGLSPAGNINTMRESQFFAPNIDVKETKSAYELLADLPGMTEKDVTADIQKGVLTLQGEKKAENEEKTETYNRVERSYGHFKRQFTLPETVNTDEVEATFENGVLKLTLPKQELPQNEVKSIPIQKK